MAPVTAVGNVFSDNDGDPLQPGPSTRPLPSARRGTASSEKTVRFGRGASIIQGPSRKNHGSDDRPSDLVQSTRPAVRPRDKAALPSRATRRTSRRRRGRLPRSTSVRHKDYTAEIEAQIDHDIKQAQRIGSTRALKLGISHEGSGSRATDPGTDVGCDLVVYTEMARLMQMTQAFAQETPRTHGMGSLEVKRKYMNRILESPENAQLVRYIGYIAMGDSNGEDGWAELLFDDTSRDALMIGIIWHALKEEVFGALWFGASADEEQSLRHLEREILHQDGFFRTKARSAKVAHFEQPIFEPDLDRAKMKLTVQLETMLQPLWQPGGIPDVQARLAVRKTLHDIVGGAAALSRIIRRAGDVIYHFASTFKDETFEPRRMDCLNLADMIRDSPYDSVTFDGRRRAILQEGQDAKRDALVRVICCPGIEAYRQGGGNVAKAEIAKEKRKQRGAPPDMQRFWRASKQAAESLSGEEGFRSKIICKGVVLLRWGRQRLLTRAAGTSAHIRAMREQQMAEYEEDYKGVVEFYDMGLERWQVGEGGSTHGKSKTTRSGRANGTVAGIRR